MRWSAGALDRAAEPSDSPRNEAVPAAGRCYGRQRPAVGVSRVSFYIKKYSSPPANGVRTPHVFPGTRRSRTGP